MFSPRKVQTLIRACAAILVIYAIPHSVLADTAESPDAVKRACKGQAEKIGLSVGDFGDVRRDGSQGRWATRLNVRGTGEKFKARCDWDGKGAPRLSVEATGLGIASKLFSEADVKSRCRSEALSSGLQVGDFGDTGFHRGSDAWVTTLWLRGSAGKYKARCAWDGFSDPELTPLESPRPASEQRLPGKQVKQACKRQAQAQGLQVGDFGDVDYDVSSHIYSTRLNVRSDGRKYKATCRWDGRGKPVVE